MSTFGGFSFTNNTDIADFLESIKEHFIEMVICHSVFLECNEEKIEDILKIAKFQVYPRLGFCLAAAKGCDDTFLFSDREDPGNLKLLYENVLNLMTNTDSPFAEGITAIAAGLTAVKLMRRLPLNSDLKHLDAAKHFEEKYEKEIAKLLDLYCKAGAPLPALKTEASLDRDCHSFFLAFAIDPLTLPAATFDQGNLADIVDLADGQVKTYDKLRVESDKLAFAYIYLSSIETETSSFRARSTTLKLADGDSLSSIIDRLAIKINRLSLADTQDVVSNLIVSPNVTQYRYQGITQIKKNLYPELNTFYDPKSVRFNLLNQLAYFSFDARRLSPIVNRELLLLDFYQISKADIVARILGDGRFPNYIGAWDTNYEYQINDLVDYQGEIYLATAASTGVEPTAANWQLIVITSDRLIEFKDFAEDSIPSLIYGTNTNYNFLDSFGPKSCVIDVQKGVASRVTTDSGAEIEDEEDLCIKFPPNSFYFRFAEGITAINGTLKIAITSIDLTKIPAINHLVDLNGYLSLTFNQVQNVSTVLLELNQLLFEVSQYTGVLAPIVKSNAVQFISFKPSKVNYKHIVDLVSIPEGLEIAIGNIYKTCGEYYNLPRSLILPVKRVPCDEECDPEVLVEEAEMIPAAAESFRFKQKNSCLVSVTEKLNRIKY